MRWDRVLGRDPAAEPWEVAAAIAFLAGTRELAEQPLASPVGYNKFLNPNRPDM